MSIPNFQEQVKIDVDNVFLNGAAMEFVTKHTIGGITGKEPAELDIVVDHELYNKRMGKDGVENISLDGLVFFVKKSLWLEHFGFIPKATSALRLDGKQYHVDAVNDDTGICEITLSGLRG